MKDLRARVGAAAAVSAILLGAAAATLGAGDVTIERLNNADKEPENWPIYGGTYRSLRYSPLDQVTVGTVGTLQAAWAFQLGVIDHGLQSTPLVVDGIMYAIASDTACLPSTPQPGRRFGARVQ